MKTYKLLLCLCAVLLFDSCEKQEKGDTVSGGQLSFSATVEDPVNDRTRLLGNDFFQVGYAIDVTIDSYNDNNLDGEYEYVYDADGVFRAKNPYRWTLDDNYLTNLTAVWPTYEIRNERIQTDQRKYDDFRVADWLTATATVQGVMATDAPVSLTFVRENAMLEFEIVGQDAQGIHIDTLLLNMTLPDGTQAACWAYCGNANGHAYLILPPDTKLESKSDYMIGLLTVNTQDKYYIILPPMDLTLEAGTHYLVTLTPQGYNMSAYIYIEGWTQGDEGIGIPFSPPEPEEDGVFTLYEPAQLVTMSYLIRHYNDNPSTFDWLSRTYVLSDEFVLTEEFARLYVPIDREVVDFTGLIQDSQGNPVTSIGYGTDQTLELYTSSN